ncbi:MAG: hypothetical protein ACH6QK_00125 [Candidatus Carsonella ruddii]
MKIKKKTIKSFKKRFIIKKKIKLLKSCRKHLLINKNNIKKSYNKNKLYLKKSFLSKIKKI